MVRLQLRQREYENSYNHSIIKRIPVIIKIDGRSFLKVTKNIQKPFCNKTMMIFSDVMLSLVKQIDGAIFGYQYSDKIIIILKNDKTLDTNPWFGNKIQDMASNSASIASYEFLTNFWNMNNAPNLEGALTFKSKAFPVPDINEAVNYIIYRQFKCMEHAINQSVFTFLKKKYGNATANMLEGKSIEDRKQILKESSIDFEDYPVHFRNGVVTYQIPTLHKTTQGQITRLKWNITEAPIFSKNRKILETIITTGSDIFRPERDLNDSIK